MVKNPPTNAGDARIVGLIPEFGRSLGVGNGNPRQHSCLENLMDNGAWQVTVRGVAKSWTKLNMHALFGIYKSVICEWERENNLSIFSPNNFWQVVSGFLISASA